MKNALNTREIRSYKINDRKVPLKMLTCYDFQTAQLLNETNLDMILVGDSLGNVILGYENTIKVTLEEMIIFSSAVKRGAPNKFVIGDMPFGAYSTLEDGIRNATNLFQKGSIEAVKLEGAFPYQLELITRLVQTGIPVMGHIGLTPQSVHQLGGYYTHGKNNQSKEMLLTSARNLQEAGVFALVLECVEASLAAKITEELSIPTIGIGSGKNTDGQVLVINDLLKMGKDKPPKFVSPVADLYNLKKELIEKYLESLNLDNENNLYH
jgi:3-methyl-2-oxobutanoate hydroxymethyltransferase